MTSVTHEGDVVTGERTIVGVDASKEVPCEFDGIHQRNGTPLGKAEWRIWWAGADKWCTCIERPKWTMCCTPCKEELLDSVGIRCIYCYVIIFIGSAILRIDAL